MREVQFSIILVFLLGTLNACGHSEKVVAAAVTGAIVGGGVGAVVGASLAADQPIDFREVSLEDVVRIEFKDREFIESQISNSVQIDRLFSQIKQSVVIEPVQGKYYKTVELILTDDRVIRIGVFNSYLKNGNDYFKMESNLNEEIKKHF